MDSTDEQKNIPPRPHAVRPANGRRPASGNPPAGGVPAPGKGKSDSPARRGGALTAPLLVFCIFALLLIVRLAGPAVFDRDNEYILLTVVQVLIFMLPAAVYLKITHTGLHRLRLIPFGVNHLLLVISAVIAAASGSLLLDFAVSGYESFSETYTLYGAFAATAGSGAAHTAYIITAYAALPALCEEFVFRAILCAEYESDGGSFSAVVLTALWFAMLHFDLRSFGVYFFSGVLLALTLYATRSFFAAFAVHFGYNLVSLFGAPLWRTVYDVGGKTLYFLVIGSALLLSLFAFCGESARLYGSYADRDLSSAYRTQTSPPEASAGGRRDGGITGAVRRAFAGNMRAFLAPSALLCYLFYVAVMLFLR